jgi:hypothetical protein
MNEFGLWLRVGVEHILDLNGYDHILFISLLVLMFPVYQWRKLLILITAFTVGHSLSLAFSVINKVHLTQTLIEFLISLTILLSGIYNLMHYKTPPKRGNFYLYIIVIFFGLIHGLGFSFLLRSMLSEGNVLLPLLYFNVGLEIGQIIIVGIVVLFSLLLTSIFKWPYQSFKLILVCIISLISLLLSIQRLLEFFH